MTTVMNPLVTNLTEESVTVLVLEDHALLAQSLVIALNAEGCRARVAALTAPATLLRQVHAPAGGGCCFVATLPVSWKRDDEVLEALEADLATDGSQIFKPSPSHHLLTHQRNRLQR